MLNVDDYQKCDITLDGVCLYSEHDDSDCKHCPAYTKWVCDELRCIDFFESHDDTAV